MSDTQSEGQIQVSLSAVASIANEAVLTCYGVVGTTAKDLTSGIVNVLSKESKRGIEIKLQDGQLVIDIYVIMEYGIRIVAVAHSIMEVVKFSIERALGIPVTAVNVHVMGLRVSNKD